MSELRIAASRLDITPEKPLRLAGFADRKTDYEKVLDPIEAQMLLLEQGDCRVLLLAADLLWWGRELGDRLRHRLAQLLQIPEDNVILTATHNHSGPATGSDFLPSLENPDQDYLRFLEDAVVKEAPKLPACLQTAKMRMWKDEIRMNVHRRLMVDGKIEMAPNFAVETDHTATVLRFCDDEGRSLVHLIHYPCHANVSAENNLNGDYPGILRKRLSEVYPDTVNIFIQGATGDVRPRVIIGDRFARMGYREAEIFGNRFADLLLALMEKSEGTRLEATLKLNRETARLPIEPRYPEHVLRKLLAKGAFEGEDAVRAEKVLLYPEYDSRQLSMKRLDLSPSYALLTVNAELVREYAAYARSLDPSLLTAGYTDGMAGYLCTADQIAEGGYEPVESGHWFTLSGTYKPEIEKIIKDTIRRLCSR